MAPDTVRGQAGRPPQSSWESATGAAGHRAASCWHPAQCSTQPQAAKENPACPSSTRNAPIRSPLWRFDSDEDRRAFWKRLFENEPFMAFAKQLRPLVKTQANQLLLAAPWGPHP